MTMPIEFVWPNDAAKTAFQAALSASQSDGAILIDPADVSRCSDQALLKQREAAMEAMYDALSGTKLVIGNDHPLFKAVLRVAYPPRAPNSGDREIFW